MRTHPKVSRYSPPVQSAAAYFASNGMGTTLEILTLTRFRLSVLPFSCMGLMMPHFLREIILEDNRSVLEHLYL